MNNLITDKRTEILNILTEVANKCSDKNILKVVDNIKNNKISDIVKASENNLTHKKFKTDLLTAAILRSSDLEASNILLNLLESYIIKYQVRFDAKERIYKSLLEYYKELCKYLDCPLEPFSIEPLDPITTTLHLLQTKDGISKADLAVQIGGIGTSKKSVDHYIGLIKTMYPLVELIKEKRGKEIFYFMPNTLHPFHLTFNMEELGVLMHCLSTGYLPNEKNNRHTISKSLIKQIGINIWNQSSQYAQDIIKSEFCIRDISLSKFIKEIEAYEPGDIIHNDLDADLLYYSKNKIVCDIELLDGKLLLNKLISYDTDKQGDYYLIMDNSKYAKGCNHPNTINYPLPIHKDNIQNIYMHKK